MRDILRQKIADGLSADLPKLTKRDVRLPGIAGKAIAVIGVRRSGKTSFLYQCLRDRLDAGAPRESQLYISFEDERLVEMQASGLTWVVEEYFRLCPGRRDHQTVAFYFDEIQNIPGWETFARRLMDTETVQLFLSGSSARLLSREVATSMRGRALEALVHPFSFREVLRHSGAEPNRPWALLPKAVRSELVRRLHDYLVEGGFPEAIDADGRDRVALLRSYVDVVVLRDVIDRHQVSNPLVLRWMQRHLLANPGGAFSIQKFYDALRSQGVSVGKDTLHAYLGHIEDAFLVRTIALHTASERQRMVNPRKAYPVDPGLIPIYERTGRANLGHALETVVLIELERRGYETAYVRTPAGREVDFIATAPGAPPLLLQVCLELTDSAIREREVRALAEAAAAFPKGIPLMVTLDTLPPQPSLPVPLQWRAAADWLLEN